MSGQPLPAGTRFYNCLDCSILSKPNVWLTILYRKYFLFDSLVEVTVRDEDISEDILLHVNASGDAVTFNDDLFREALEVNNAFGLFDSTEVAKLTDVSGLELVNFGNKQEAERLFFFTHECPKISVIVRRSFGSFSNINSIKFRHKEFLLNRLKLSLL